MKLSDSYVFLNQARFHARHGVIAQENVVGGEFIVSIRARVDVTHAAETDEVGDTVSYAELYEVARREMQKPSRLLEHVAGRIAKAVLDGFPAVASVEVRLTKENPPMGACCLGCGVELHAERD